MSGFNAGMSGLINKCRISAQTVVRKETGELIKELVRLSPPKDPKKTRDQIKATITNRFTLASHGGHRDFAKTSGTVGASGIKWYFVDGLFLRGVKNENLDQRKADANTLYALYHKLSPKGRQILPFKHPRQRQRVMLSQKVLTKSSTINQVVRRVMGHVGRLKAGWMVAVSSGAITLSGGKLPPQWVTRRHLHGARGRIENGLDNKTFPTFTIANSAKGVGQAAVKSFAALAVKSRAASMVTNARLIFAGKKTIAAYAQ
jgi:hypothetical protein